MAWIFSPITLKENTNAEILKGLTEEMDRTVSWPLLPDEFTITTLFTIREEKTTKTQWAISFQRGHARGAHSSNCFIKRFIW